VGPALLGMHAPDGLFSLPINVLFGLVVAVLLAVACAGLSRRPDHRLVPMMGILAAFVFAGQMVNFPISSGTTGHLLGGTLTAILVGPWAGTVVMASVIIFQALLGDGGITVLGPNIFNMGVVGTCLAYYIYRLLVGRSLQAPARVVAASFFAAWVSLPLGSVFASLQLAVSGTASLNRALPAMVLTHMVIGVGEALITAGVVAFVIKTRPDLLYGQPTSQAQPAPGRLVVGLGLLGSLVIATGLSLLPHWWDHPDGLEFVGQQQGFLREEPQAAEGGSLVTLPAYPLGVRLSMADGRVVAAHCYDRQAGPLMPGDILRSIDSRPISDLTSAAAALHIDVADGQCDLTPGQWLQVVVQRGGQDIPLTVQASPAPRAGATAPVVALLPDYTLPGVSGLISTSLAGGIGTTVMFLAALGAGRLLMRPLPGMPTDTDFTGPAADRKGAEECMRKS